MSRTKTHQPVPISDPKRTLIRCAEEIAIAMNRVLASGRYVGGEEVHSFEKEFATYLGASHVVALGSGTDAIELALRACGVKPGDRVATVSLTAVGTIAAIERAGAVPVFVDIDPQRLTLDPEQLGRLLDTGRIRAIIPVHLYGGPADMQRIMALAGKYEVSVIEDCAQAHGADIGGKKCGTWGDMGAFSFYPTKNLGALGDGGAVATTDPKLADRALLLREYGWREHHISEISGMNSRLDSIQAAILRVRLNWLERDNERRREIAGEYGKALTKAHLVLPAAEPSVRHVYHQYVVQTAQRDALHEHMMHASIQTAIHYPQPIHLQPAYRDRLPVHGDCLPHTERVCRTILSLPCFPDLSNREVGAVIGALMSFLEGVKLRESRETIGRQRV